MRPYVSLLTLGVEDLAVTRRFYEAMGWSGQEVEETVFLQAGALVVVLWDRRKLAADAGVTDTGGAPHGHVVLAHNVASPDEVRSILDDADRAGGRITRPAATTFYGGYAGCFTDPDGHVWEIAHNPGFVLREDGSVELPDFSSPS